MPLTTRQVTARYQDAAGAPATGYVTFTPTAPLGSAIDDTIIWPEPVYATLDAEGDLTATLLATDAAGVLPAGWVYTVAEHITGAQRAPWLAAIPAGIGGLDLADVAPLEELPDLVAYDPAGSAAAALAAAQAALLAKAANLADLANAAAARTNLGLGTARDLLLREALTPPGRYETRSRIDSGINSTTMTSGVLFLVPIWLPAGLAVASITFVSGNTALAGATHQWFGLYDNNRVQLATTVNDGAAAWPTNTAKTLAIAQTAAGGASSYVTTYAGLHLLGLMVAASTMPTVMGGGAANVALGPVAPAFGGANTGQTGPPAFPFTASAPILAAPLLYGYLQS